MLPSLECFRETHIIGKRCREHMLDSEQFPVLRNAPFIWVGLSRLRAPYRIVRGRSVHSHIVVAVRGYGRTVIDGKVVRWKPGQVMLGPVGAPHAFEVEGSGPWHIAWVFFDDTERAPVLRGRNAELIEADTADFVAALGMLTRESAGAADPTTMAALVTVLDTCARRIAGNRRVDTRLSELWSKIESDLAHPWTLATMSRAATMSEEHLRRLCQRDFQQSPIEHLTQLRLRRAGLLLRSTAKKIDEIASLVGYGSLYSFSTAFKRWSGQPPSRIRGSGKGAVWH